MIWIDAGSSIRVCPFTSSRPGLCFKYSFSEQNQGFTVRQSLEHLLACFCQKTNCRVSMWPLYRNWLSSWDYQNLRFLPWPGVKRGALYFLVSFHYVRTSMFCGVSTLTSLLFSLEEFELRALPKSEMNCRTISKLLSTLIRADTSGLPAGYGALT